MEHLDNYCSAQAFEQQSWDFGTEGPVPFDSSYSSESPGCTNNDRNKILRRIQCSRICNQLRDSPESWLSVLLTFWRTPIENNQHFLIFFEVETWFKLRRIKEDKREVDRKKVLNKQGKGQVPGVLQKHPVLPSLKRKYSLYNHSHFVIIKRMYHSTCHLGPRSPRSVFDFLPDDNRPTRGNGGHWRQTCEKRHVGRVHLKVCVLSAERRPRGHVSFSFLAAFPVCAPATLWFGSAVITINLKFTGCLGRRGKVGRSGRSSGGGVALYLI